MYVNEIGRNGNILILLTPTPSLVKTSTCWSLSTKITLILLYFSLPFYPQVTAAFLHLPSMRSDGCVNVG